MSNTSEKAIDDPYRIESIAEIDQILLDMIKQGVLIRMSSDNPNHSIITTLIDVDFDNNQLIIDGAAQEDINQQLIETKKVYLSTQLNQINIEFMVQPIIATTYKGSPALAVPIPHSLRRLQRRSNYRVQPSTIKPATCTILYQKKIITLQVFDISASGVSILDTEHILEANHINKGHIFPDCELSLPGIGSLTIDLQLVRQQSQGVSLGKKISRYGCAFFSFKPADQIRVQNYIDQEERQRIARERGLA